MGQVKKVEGRKVEERFEPVHREITWCELERK